MLSDILFTLFLALILTIVIEVCVVWALNFKDKIFIIIVILVNVITNPSLNLIISLSYHYTTTLMPFYVLLILEVLIILIEAIILFKVFPKYSFKLMLLVSSIMNITSFSIGIGIQWLFPNILN
ncbi:hypothetical protein [Liberiplasma polymorphum]|uniref:hypothetical protein n=1 Tax=Liberiplasma polymorphum TaxID=3374570 RepID=UPI00377205D5